MKETVWMILGGLSIVLILYSMVIMGTVIEEKENSWIGWEQPAPAERHRWPNPAGYGLPAETEEYGGLVW